MKHLGEVIQGVIVFGRVVYLYHKNRKPYMPLGVTANEPARLTRKRAFINALDGNDQYR